MKTTHSNTQGDDAELVLLDEVGQVETEVTAIVVDSQESYELAGRAVIGLDRLIKKIKEYWRGPKDAAFQAHRAIVARETEMLKPVKTQRAALNSKVSGYLTEQNRIRREQQQKLDNDRRKKEEAERARLAKRADTAEAKGKPEKAEDLRTKAGEVSVPVAVIAPVVPKTTKTEAGSISQRTSVEVEVIDAKLVLGAVIDGTLPMSVVTIRQAKIQQFVKLQGLTEVPGCKLTEVVNASFRGGR